MSTFSGIPETPTTGSHMMRGALGARVKLSMNLHANRICLLRSKDANTKEDSMTAKQWVASVATIAALAAVVLVGATLFRSASVQAAVEDSEASKIQQGFAIAPVPLNLAGKNRALVGLGSYIVNAHADCNGCHSAGPATEYSLGGNPYLRFPAFFTGKKEVNPATYLAGGRDFGPIGSVPHLYSRNLTPDKTGLPEGGHTFAEFVEIMRNGADLDHVHPNCTAPFTPANCFEPPFNGDLLQVMPWPVHQDMTDRDLRAIYEYLSAIPCNPGPVIAGAEYLQNICP